MNRYTFVWKEVIVKNEAKMHVKISLLMNEINLEYMQAFSFDPENAASDLEKVSLFLEQKCTDEGIEFVHGSGKRPNKLQKKYESAVEYLKR